ncbi:hypothetical protein FA13DRAFT_1818507 [Coprinellus micaceus]|uniref:DNA recombination and repair protein Rad51-like C-terminal domain-containing protein n=1 Tax=Coprinellus micaceus TaxID=71717 RepID=A0A4Y7SQ79_COPMI|nr:hypothetical protein FA13DRAFT_1818507 [Coprinellus micaceus]
MAPNRSILFLPLPKSTIASLTAAGFETLKDLSNATADGLAHDLGLSHEVAAQILAVREPSGTMPLALPQTQSAAALSQASRKLQTGCQALDDLLKGGVQGGHILELSGPPGTPKELVVMNLIGQFVNDQNDVLIADCQNMINRRVLMGLCREGAPSIRYSKPQSLSHLLLFIEQLPALAGTTLKVKNLTRSQLNVNFIPNNGAQPLEQDYFASEAKASAREVDHRQSIDGPFVPAFLSPCASGPHLVIKVIITCQLATKLLNSDGSPGTFDTGAQGIMVPQLGSV